MLNLYTYGGCECWLTKKTNEALLTEWAQWEAEHYNPWDDDKLWAAVDQARAAWEASGDPMDWDYYSDIYKDLHGFRPRS